jgi:hypothetical protein
MLPRILMVLLVTLFFAGSLFAGDSPRQAPQDIKEFSPNHHFFLISKVKEKRTQVFGANQASTVLWEVPVYLQIADLSDDGRHIAASYAGGNILENNVRPSDPLITFFNASGSKRIVTVVEVAGDIGKLRRSDSGFPWGRVLGFQPTGRLLVILDSGKTLTLDPDSR